jgi:class 3 adenylate cyclase
VLFCDLVDSTRLASQLDAEDYREVVQAYQATCAKVIARFEGHIAQYLGDGLLVYFGYPRAHEDDAQRAVTAGLGIIQGVGQLNSRLARGRGVQLAVRLGIHTGLVVVGEMGGGDRHEQLALGATPNLAARLQGIAAPNTLVISAATLPRLGGFFVCQSLGTSLLKGFAQPLEVYQVLYESMARSRLEAAGSAGLTPLVGREQEIGLLLERWAQVKDGLGQVVLLSKGELLLRQATPDEAQAETCWHQAPDIARRQHTKSWELRAATSLARLWQQQGKGVEAYELLAPIYGWFTEGSDTADLQEAKALLGELRRQG